MNLELLANYGPRMLDGLTTTVEIVVLSMLIGGLIAVPLALVRVGGGRGARAFAFAYSYLFRGTPLIAQTFLVYYGAGEFRDALETIGLWWFFRDPYWCVLFTFSLNTAAYQSEIFRGAIQAVPEGQTEAAKALGLRGTTIFRRVVAPQAALIALRPYGNEIILMIKGSAIASVVTVFDLMGATSLAFSRSFSFEVYLWAAVLYLALVEIVRRAWDLIEHRLTRHMRPVEAAPVGGMEPAI